MDKRFWAVIGVIAVIFVGIIWASNSKKADTEGSNGGKSSGQTTNHVKGENSKKVTLVEYGDFQCPVCGMYEPTVQQVYAKYEKDIQFQFRHFPLQTIHQNAFAASRAAEAASYQNKFWEMHDQLYANQQDWSVSTDPVKLFQQYAQGLGMNTDQFKKEFASKKVNDAVNADIRAGEKLKITGTPTFFINGKEIELKTLTDPKTNQPTLEAFSKAIDAAIKQQSNK